MQRGWPGSTLITVRVTNPVVDAVSGNALYSPWQMQFHTAAQSTLIPPTISLQTPTNGAVIAGNLQISGTASDTVAVQQVASAIGQRNLDHRRWNEFLEPESEQFQFSQRAARHQRPRHGHFGKCFQHTFRQCPVLQRSRKLCAARQRRQSGQRDGLQRKCLAGGHELYFGRVWLFAAARAVIWTIRSSASARRRSRFTSASVTARAAADFFISLTARKAFTK